MPIAGVIFDLDGTLVESCLDFEAMRVEMELPPGVAILEALDEMPATRRARCVEILDRHERQGVERAHLMPGADVLCAALRQRGIRQAVLTRNSRPCTLATLSRFGLEFDPVVTREDAPPKPDPTAILEICHRWKLPAQQVVMLGDYVFDLEAGRAAGCRTVLFSRGRKDEQRQAWRRLYDFDLADFEQAAQLLEWLAGQ